MKFYRINYITRHNGTYIGDEVATILTNEEMQNKIIHLTWDNLKEFYHNNGLSCSFNIWNFKKGRLVSFFSHKLPFKDYADIKEWKKPLNIDIEVKYREYRPSIDEVLKWYDAKKAKEYLEQL
jgi:hypothetical protein